MELHERLQKAREYAGFQTAAEAAEALGMKYPTYAGHENGSSGFRANKGEVYARRFKVSFEWLMSGRGEMIPGGANTVPLKGKVGAGQQVEAVDNGDLDEAPAPPDATPSTVAVQISGDSMFPTYEEGSLIYYSRHLPPSEMVNRRAVVQLADGRIFLKVIRPGSTPDFWTLQSINAQYPDIEDVVIEWAAPIDWIRPRA